MGYSVLGVWGDREKGLRPVSEEAQRPMEWASVLMDGKGEEKAQPTSKTFSG